MSVTEPVAGPGEVQQPDGVQRTWRAFLPVWEANRRRLVALARELNLTPPQVWALQHLEPGRPRPMRELAPVLVCESSNVTGVTDRLERRGLVERQPDPSDRRIRNLALTGQGIAVRDVILARMAEPLPGFEELDEQELEALTSVLERIARLSPL